MSNSLEILEERVAALEKQIYGNVSMSAAKEKFSETPVIENLLNINTFISTALSGRESINTLINRLPELSNYLDSNFEDCDSQTDAKLEYILTSEAQIKENLRLLTEIEKLNPVLEIESMKEAPELSKKLNTLSLNYLPMNEESKALNREIHDLFNNYNSIINSISETLIQMDSKITMAEIAATPKKQVD
ncbi:uncharacterized protein LOC127289119 [Leptopilina boulardi]|uniref:uncharacterized protein LOC127289119 n=1 Tax=Leptopilina boulardi TaxID=63433 RepID=UPI0021F63923|nr:uncharacterized protein LOC127289119 [Leptopilina boulardi]